MNLPARTMAKSLTVFAGPPMISVRRKFRTSFMTVPAHLEDA
jgi:hypothetical protein